MVRSAADRANALKANAAIHTKTRFLLIPSPPLKAVPALPLGAGDNAPQSLKSNFWDPFQGCPIVTVFVGLVNTWLRAYIQCEDHCGKLKDVLRR
jgi:hypothetical protein